MAARLALLLALGAGMGGPAARAEGERNACLRELAQAEENERRAHQELDPVWQEAGHLRREDPARDAAYKAREDFIAECKAWRDRKQAELDQQAARRDQIIADARKALAELAARKFCSKCQRTPTEIWRDDHETFEAHIERVQAVEITDEALAALIEQKRAAFQQEIDAATKACKDAVDAANAELDQRRERLKELDHQVDAAEAEHRKKIMDMETRVQTGIFSAHEAVERARLKLQTDACTDRPAPTMAPSEPALERVVEAAPRPAPRRPPILPTPGRITLPRGTRSVRFHFTDDYPLNCRRNAYLSADVLGKRWGGGTYVYSDATLNSCGNINPSYFFGTAPFNAVDLNGPHPSAALKDGGSWDFKSTCSSIEHPDANGFEGFDGELVIDGLAPALGLGGIQSIPIRIGVRQSVVIHFQVDGGRP